MKNSKIDRKTKSFRCDMEKILKDDPIFFFLLILQDFLHVTYKGFMSKGKFYYVSYLFLKSNYFFRNIFRKIIKIGRYICYPKFLFFQLIRDIWSPNKNIFWVTIIFYPYEKYNRSVAKKQQNPIFVDSGRPGFGNFSTFLGSSNYSIYK